MGDTRNIAFATVMIVVNRASANIIIMFRFHGR